MGLEDPLGIKYFTIRLHFGETHSYYNYYKRHFSNLHKKTSSDPTYKADVFYSYKIYFFAY